MMNIDTGVCIGGPADGERRLCVGSFLEVPVMDGGNIGDMTATMKIHVYTREVFECNKTIFHYWRHSSFTVEETIERLFRAYQEVRR